MQSCWHAAADIGLVAARTNRRPTMTNFFNSSETLRSLVGIVAAAVIGGTFLLAAAGPAVAAPVAFENSVNFTANSNIVRSA